MNAHTHRSRKPTAPRLERLEGRDCPSSFLFLGDLNFHGIRADASRHPAVASAMDELNIVDRNRGPVAAALALKLDPLLGAHRAAVDPSAASYKGWIEVNSFRAASAVRTGDEPSFDFHGGNRENDVRAEVSFNFTKIKVTVPEALAGVHKSSPLLFL